MNSTEISTGMTLVSRSLSHFEGSSLPLSLSLPHSSLPPQGPCRGPVEHDRQKSPKLSLALSQPPFLLLPLCPSPYVSRSPPSITHPLLPHLTLNMGKFWGNFKEGRMIWGMDYLKQAALDLNTLILGLNICVSLPQAAHNCPNYNQ